MFTVALFIIAKIWKQSKCPSTDEWIKKIYIYMFYIYIHTHTYTYIHTHNGILFSHKKNENLRFAMTWMDLLGIMLSETSLTEEDKYCMILFIFEI